MTVEDRYRADCGCVWWTEKEGGVRRFVMVPCSFICPRYLFAIRETTRQGKRVEHQLIFDDGRNN